MWSVVSLLSCLLMCLQVTGQVPVQAGGRAAVIGGVLTEDAWSARNNPASLPSLTQFQAGIYVQRLYNIKELNSGAVAAAIPFDGGKGGCMGFSASAFNAGTGLRTQLYTLSYGLKFAPKLQGGVGLHAIHIRFGDIYGGALLPAGSAGIIYTLTKNTAVGFHGFNIAQVRFKGSYEQRLPATIEAAVRHKVGSQLALHAQAQHELKQRMALIAGIEYKPVKTIALQAGVKTHPMLFGAGAGFYYKDMRINLAFAFGQALGTTPHLTLEYAPQEEK